MNLILRGGSVGTLRLLHHATITLTSHHHGDKPEYHQHKRKETMSNEGALRMARNSLVIVNLRGRISC